MTMLPSQGRPRRFSTVQTVLSKLDQYGVKHFILAIAPIAYICIGSATFVLLEDLHPSAKKMAKSVGHEHPSQRFPNYDAGKDYTENFIQHELNGYQWENRWGRKFVTRQKDITKWEREERLRKLDDEDVSYRTLSEEDKVKHAEALMKKVLATRRPETPKLDASQMMSLRQEIKQETEAYAQALEKVFRSRECRKKRKRWDFASGVIYAISLITTMGHKSLKPQSIETQIATAVFCLLGIPLLLLCLTDYGQLVAHGFRLLRRWWRYFTRRFTCDQHKTLLEIQEADARDIKMHLDYSIHWCVGVCLMLGWIFFFPLIIMIHTPSTSYLSALYTFILGFCTIRFEDRYENDLGAIVLIAVGFCIGLTFIFMTFRIARMKQKCFWSNPSAREVSQYVMTPSGGAISSDKGSSSTQKLSLPMTRHLNRNESMLPRDQNLSTADTGSLDDKLSFIPTSQPAIPIVRRAPPVPDGFHHPVNPSCGTQTAVSFQRTKRKRPAPIPGQTGLLPLPLNGAGPSTVSKVNIIRSVETSAWSSPRSPSSQSELLIGKSRDDVQRLFRQYPPPPLVQLQLDPFEDLALLESLPAYGKNSVSNGYFNQNLAVDVKNKMVDESLQLDHNAAEIMAKSVTDSVDGVEDEEKQSLLGSGELKKKPIIKKGNRRSTAASRAAVSSSACSVLQQPVFDDVLAERAQNGLIATKTFVGHSGRQVKQLAFSIPCMDDQRRKKTSRKLVDRTGSMNYAVATNGAYLTDAVEEEIKSF